MFMMCGVPTFLILACTACLVAAQKCSLPPGAILWDPNPANTVHTVSWGYGSN
ncbi:unnamed protein product, partial [Candidula unifasciata]